MCARCLSLSFKPEFAAGQLDEFRFIDLCAQLELDGVDFNLGSFRSLERDHLKKIKKGKRIVTFVITRSGVEVE